MPHAQGLGKTVSTIALLLSNEAPCMAAARRGSSTDTAYPAEESSENSSAYTPPPAARRRRGGGNRRPRTRRHASSEDKADADSSAGAASEQPPAEPAALQADADSSAAAASAQLPAAAPAQEASDEDCIVLDGDGEGGAVREGGAKQVEPPERPWFEGDLRGGTLVVCPTSVLHQWRGELREKVAASTGAHTQAFASCMQI